MKSRLEVVVPNFGTLISALQAFDLEDPAQEAIEESTSILLNRTRKRFLAQNDPEGTAWEPSFAAFVRSFTGRGGGTLFDTGTLFHSIQLYEVSPLEQGIGTDVAYGVYHQEGTEKLPQRMFLGFSDEDQSLAMAVFISKYKEAFDAIGN